VLRKRWATLHACFSKDVRAPNPSWTRIYAASHIFTRCRRPILPRAYREASAERHNSRSTKTLSTFWSRVQTSLRCMLPFRVQARLKNAVYPSWSQAAGCYACLVALVLREKSLALSFVTFSTVFWGISCLSRPQDTSSPLRGLHGPYCRRCVTPLYCLYLQLPWHSLRSDIRVVVHGVSSKVRLNYYDSNTASRTTADQGIRLSNTDHVARLLLPHKFAPNFFTML
jgi:hypothetical protein